MITSILWEGQVGAEPLLAPVLCSPFLSLQPRWTRHLMHCTRPRQPLGARVAPAPLVPEYLLTLSELGAGAWLHHRGRQAAALCLALLLL